MKFICAMILVALPLLASAASIQMVAPDGTCRLDISTANPWGTFSVIAADLQSFCGNCLEGAELRIVGLSSDWAATITPSPQANTVLGDPLGAGANIAFPACQSQSEVLLYSISIHYLLGGVPPPTTLQVVAHTTPSHPDYLCPLIVGEYGPVFCRECVAGGVLFINQASDCTVALKPATWSTVKAMYD